MRRLERRAVVSASCGLGLLLLASSAIGQAAPKPAPAAAAPPAAAVTATPSRTTASFGDWTLRCDRFADATPPRHACELSLVVQNAADQNVLAQIAVGRPAAGEPLRITTVLPVNITVAATPKLIIDGKEAGSLDLAWVRCLPGGCIATAVVSDDVLRKLKTSPSPGQIEYHDAAGRDVKLPIPWRGFSEAFDALGKESAN
jgi:invasion protein IalB